MTVFPRKLFPYLTSTTNQTEPCTPGFCHPTCTNFDDCNSFPDPDWVPPPLPLPPLPPLPADQGHHISPVVIIVAIVLASAFLLIVSYYTLVVKGCSFWTRRNPDPTQSDPADLHHETTENLFHDTDDQDPVIDHPIWLISTVGLQQSVINSITVIRYKRGDGLVDLADCSVCLSEFQEGETLRLLPKCNHAFHIDCVDTWLSSHTNCPFCRAGIVLNPGVPSSGSSEPSFGQSRRIESTPMEVSDSSDVALDSSHTGNGSGTGDFNVDDDDQNKAEINNYQGTEGVVLSARRSFSLDFFLGPNSRNVGDPHLQSNMNSSSFHLLGSCSSSSRGQLPAMAAPIKRSHSWSEMVLGSTPKQNSNSDISP